MKRNFTVFENEEAVRLLNYFVLYKEIICKNVDQSSQAEDGIILGAIPRSPELVIK